MRGEPSSSVLQGHLLDTLCMLERERLAVSKKNRNISIVIGSLWLAINVVLCAADVGLNGLLITLPIALITRWLLTHKSRGNLLYKYKELVLPQVVAAVRPGLRYDGAECISETEFTGCGLFRSPDRYNGKDYIEGMVGDTHIRFSMVDAEEEEETTVTETDSDGNTTTHTETRWVTIFCGLLFSADFNKHFAGRTLVRSGGSGILSGLSRSHVKLEDPRFNERFKVNSAGQVEARYLLTPSLMQRVLALEEKFGCWLSISFVDSRIYVAIQLHYNSFEPSLTCSFKDFGQVRQIMDTVKRIVGIVEDLDLNTRIWSKSAGTTGI